MRNSLRSIALLLVMCLLISCIPMAAFAKDMDIANNRILYPKEFNSEKEAGLLTEEASAKIKDLIKQQNVKDIKKLLDPYFKNCVRQNGSIIPSMGILAVGGDTRYRRTYDNSGIITYKSKSGIWSAIANATIATVLGTIKTVGIILSYTYSVIAGYTPNYQREAAAKTQYSYRYIVDNGEVYDDLEGLGWYAAAIAVSREKYQHEYGYYIDSMGYAKSHTRDYPGSIETLNAPHKGQSTWLRNMAYERWYFRTPSYYEDWTD